MTSAVWHVNVSTARPIAVSTPVAAVRSGKAASEWRRHLYAFFDETYVETPSDIASANLLPGYDTRLWFGDRS